MERTQIGGKRIRIIFLILIISMCLFACADGNSHEDIITTSDMTETHSETDPVETQTVIELTLEDLPALLPDVLGLREKKYEDMPFLETQEQLSEYALWNLLWGRTEFECRLSWDLSYGVSAAALERSCEDAMTYYLFSSYKPWDMLTEDDGDPDSVYGKIKLVYDNPEYDLEARLAAYSYVMNNPPPEGGFSDYDEEMEYARKIHDYVACKVTYDPMGYVLCRASVQPIVECLKKLRQPCAHSWRHVCTRPSRFLYSDLCTLHKYAIKRPSRNILL